jgi:predicted phosphodiesterase
MTALVTADLHLSAKSRDDYRFTAMVKIGELVEKHKVDTLLLLGDLTEEKDYHSAALVNDVVDVVYSFSELCDVYVLRGNHDYTQVDCPFFHFLRRIKRVRWINAPDIYNLSIGKCLFLPHTRDHRQEWVADRGIDFEGWDYIFAHNTFEGASTEHGKKLSGIPLDVFRDDAPVISGDIHTPQTLGPVTYVGSPYTVDFGDSFEPRVLLLTNNKGSKSIPLPGAQKRLLEFKTGYKLSNLPANPGDIVKVRYNLALGEQDKWHEIKEALRRQLIEAGMVVHLVQPVTTAKTRSVVIRKAETKSDTRLVQEFGKQLKLPAATLKAGLDLLEEA